MDIVGRSATMRPTWIVVAVVVAILVVMLQSAPSVDARHNSVLARMRRAQVMQPKGEPAPAENEGNEEVAEEGAEAEGVDGALTNGTESSTGEAAPGEEASESPGEEAPSVPAPVETPSEAATESPSIAAQAVEVAVENGAPPSEAVANVQEEIAAGKEAGGESPSEAAHEAAETIAEAASALPPEEAEAATQAAEHVAAEEKAGEEIAAASGETVAPAEEIVAETNQEVKEEEEVLEAPPPIGDAEKDPLGAVENKRENTINADQKKIIHKLEKLQKEAIASKEAWLKRVMEENKKKEKAMKAHDKGEWHDYHQAPQLEPVKSVTCTKGC